GARRRLSTSAYRKRERRKEKGAENSRPPATKERPAAVLPQPRPKPPPAPAAARPGVARRVPAAHRSLASAAPQREQAYRRARPRPASARARRNLRPRSAAAARAPSPDPRGRRAWSPSEPSSTGSLWSKPPLPGEPPRHPCQVEVAAIPT